MGESLDRRGELLDLLAVVKLVERLRNERLQPVQLLGVERLLYVVVGALPHGLHGRIDGRLPGDDDALSRDARVCISLSSASPSSLGIIRSASATPNVSLVRRSIAFWPSSATSISYPSSDKIAPRPSVMERSSSAIRIFGFFMKDRLGWRVGPLRETESRSIARAE